MEKAKIRTTRYAMQQRAKKSLPRVLQMWAGIPYALGPNTYILATIAANGGIVRQTDIYTSLGASATRVASVDAKRAGMVRTSRLKSKQIPGLCAPQQMKSMSILAPLQGRTLDPLGKRHPIRDNVCPEILVVLSNEKFGKLMDGFFNCARSLAGSAKRSTAYTSSASSLRAAI